MKLAEVTGWIEEHPTESIVIGAGGLIAILWLLGYFGSSSSASAGSSNLASAYYAAEAQQAVVGGQIQMATIQSAAATAQNAAQVNGAVAVAKAQAKAATTINGQNASAGTTIDAADDQATIAQSNNQLLATYSNNATALGTVQSNNAALVADTTNTNNANLMGSWINNILPTEFATYGNLGFSTNLPGGLGSFSTSVLANPDMAKALGFTATGAEQTFGWPAGSVQP